MDTQLLLVPTDKLARAFLIPIMHCQPNEAVEIGEFLSIGRDTINGLILTDPFASLRHARLEKQTNGWILRDLGSRNGSFCNGSRCTEVHLRAGDHLRFGESVFLFSESATQHARMSSKNSAWNGQLARMDAFAKTDFPVLITGPSGSGKDVLARWIHSHSLRAQNAYVSINCSALSENLIESELFGHLRGSFTGALTDRKGAFETARQGVLFLDEIGDLPLSLQPKLLRALENGEIKSLGSDKVMHTDVRVLAATHKDLVSNVKKGLFREDLYYRLCVCQIKTPALKDRMEDFDELLMRFAREYKVRFSFCAIEELKRHQWPGNIRELKNTVVRAAAYFPGKHIQPEDIGSLIDSVLAEEPSNPLDARPSQSVIKELERELIVQRLRSNSGNQRKTAQDLGLAKSTLHDRIRSYQIDIKNFR